MDPNKQDWLCTLSDFGNKKLVKWYSLMSIGHGDLFPL